MIKPPVTLQDNETVILATRRHWIFLWPRTLLMLLAGLVPAAALLAGVAVVTGLDGTAGLVAAGVAALWLVFWLVRAYFNWYRYHNDVWVVTNQRLIDSLKRHWFHHDLASADLVDVEDISVERRGILATALNFGDVRCQTAGVQANFILSGVPRPSDVLSTIDAARDAARRELRIAT
ncbi:MAG: hypothetical protein Kow0010_05510 [Dehalococcoidia bacterium]